MIMVQRTSIASSQSYTRSCLFGCLSLAVLLAFWEPATSSADEYACFDKQVASWPGYKALAGKNQDRFEERLKNVCQLVTGKKISMNTATLIALASLAKLTGCRGKNVAPNAAQNIYPLSIDVGKEDPFQIRNQRQKAFKSFCAGAQYNNLASLPDKYSKLVTQMGPIDEDASCWEMIRPPSLEKSLGSAGRLWGLFSDAAILNNPMYAPLSNLHKEGESLCLDIKRGKISLSQADNLWRTEFIIAMHDQKLALANKVANSSEHFFSDLFHAPSRFLSWLASSFVWLVGFLATVVGFLFGVIKLFEYFKLIKPSGPPLE